MVRLSRLYCLRQPVEERLAESSIPVRPQQVIRRGDRRCAFYSVVAVLQIQENLTSLAPIYALELIRALTADDVTSKKSLLYDMTDGGFSADAIQALLAVLNVPSSRALGHRIIDPIAFWKARCVIPTWAHAGVPTWAHGCLVLSHSVDDRGLWFLISVTCVLANSANKKENAINELLNFNAIHQHFLHFSAPEPPRPKSKRAGAPVATVPQLGDMWCGTHGWNNGHGHEQCPRPCANAHVFQAPNSNPGVAHLVQTTDKLCLIISNGSHHSAVTFMDGVILDCDSVLDRALELTADGLHNKVADNGWVTVVPHLSQQQRQIVLQRIERTVHQGTRVMFKLLEAVSTDAECHKALVCQYKSQRRRCTRFFFFFFPHRAIVPRSLEHNVPT